MKKNRLASASNFKCFLKQRTSNDNNNPDSVIAMQEKGYSGFVRHVMDVLYFLASLIKHLLGKTAYTSYYLKLSLPMLLECFLIFAQIQPRVSYRYVSYKKHVNKIRHCK